MAQRNCGWSGNGVVAAVAGCCLFLSVETPVMAAEVTGQPAAAPASPSPPAPAAAPAAAASGPVSAPAPPPETPTEREAPPVELWLGIGAGNAVCDNKKPDSDCPVETGSAVALGGAWRLSKSWALGAELAGWQFGVRDEWRGQLEDPATDVKFSSTYFALVARWYWLAKLGSYQGYLQFGLGGGVVTGEATAESGAKYRVSNSGVVFPLGIGFDFELADVFRLGPQALAYLQSSSTHCEELNGGGETCSDSGEEDNALPYRFLLVGTFNFGG
ncbi:MAG: hypothetical protein AB7K71_16845 [Polyangiaceae bacterium]